MVCDTCNQSMHGEPHPTYNLGLGGGQEENWHVLNYMVQASILRAQTCIASWARLFPFHSTNQFCIGTWRGRVWRLRTCWCERLERNYWIGHFHMLHTESDWRCRTERIWPARLPPTYCTNIPCLPVVHCVWQGDMGGIHKEFSKDFKHRTCIPYAFEWIHN